MYKGINRSDTVTLFLIPLGFLTPPTSSLNLRGLGFHQLVIQQISFFIYLISLIPLYLYISLFNFYDDRWRVGLQSGGNNLHLWCFIYRAPASAPKPARFFGFSLLIGIFSVRASCSISWQGICFFCFIDFCAFPGVAKTVLSQVKICVVTFRSRGKMKEAKTPR